MTFPTKLLDLSGGPINLLDDPEIAAVIAADPTNGVVLFLQNVGTRSKVYYLEQRDEPARTDRGHCLLVGDGFTLRLAAGAPLGAWVWASSTGTAAVSPGNG